MYYVVWPGKVYWNIEDKGEDVTKEVKSLVFVFDFHVWIKISLNSRNPRGNSGKHQQSAQKHSQKEGLEWKKDQVMLSEWLEAGKIGFCVVFLINLDKRLTFCLFWEWNTKDPSDKFFFLLYSSELKSFTLWSSPRLLECSSFTFKIRSPNELVES